MSIRKRLVYFAIGLFIGIIFVQIILDKKGLSLTDYFGDYLPNGRVLNTLKSKQRVFDQKALSFFQDQQIDTSKIGIFLTKGDVNFDKSRQREKPCNFYQIEVKHQKEKLGFYIKNCDSIVTIQDAFKIYEK
jgi:hypothetical protein